MGDYLGTKLDANQVLRRSYDESSNRLRVDAAVTASIGDLIISATDSTIAISDGVDTLLVNPDGSINVNVHLSHSSDSVQLGDGTTLFTGTTNGAKTGLDVNLINNVIPLPTGAATESTLSSIDTKTPNLGQATMSASVPVTLASDQSPVNVQATDLDIRNLTSATDSIASVQSGTWNIQDVTGTISLPTGAATSALQTSANSSLSSIDGKIPSQGQKVSAQSLPVVLSSDQSPLPIELEAFTGVTPDNVQMVGSIDGTKTGTKFGFVNNVRQQVLSSHDRQAELTYADFGTKDQRITRIDYTSATFPGVTVRKDFVYTLVGTKYRRDDINWSLV